MQRILTALVVIIGVLSSACDVQRNGSDWTASDETSSLRSSASHTASGALVRGTISLPEISGARAVGDKVIVVADDAANENDDVRQYHMVAAIDINRFLTGGAIELNEEDHRYRRIIEHLAPARMRSDLITDLEAVASDDRYLYLVTSHSRSRRDNYPAKRRRLVRIVMDGDRISSAEFSATRLETVLPEELHGSTERRPADEIPGFNIEGMAVSPEGDLLFGLRSPLIDGNAVVLAANAESLWDTDHEHELELRHLLDLGGLGIRAIERDSNRTGFWLIAGAASDVDTADNPWSIWFLSDAGALTNRWTFEDAPSEIRNPEALAVLSVEDADDHLLVISDNGDRRPGTFVLLPIDD